jgi:hypothetical protein
VLSYDLVLKICENRKQNAKPSSDLGARGSEAPSRSRRQVARASLQPRAYLLAMRCLEQRCTGLVVPYDSLDLYVEIIMEIIM